MNSNIAGIPIKGAFFLAAGPCSAESEDQINLTVEQLFNELPNGVDIIRAGIWKPRTRPNAFEGIGQIGLKWLVDVGKKHKTPVCTEVANTQHVTMALKAGVDALWIGSRTTVNPFSVQEIAEALKGTNTPVFVKNPINPDLELWIGAIERLQNQGIEKIVAIHRGFTSFDKSTYRNIPKWDIPIALKSRMSHIPIICDPSHISGNRSLIHSVSQQALDLTMSGLIIETHHNPEKAWSDADQQLTPAALAIIVKQLIVRKAAIEKEIATLNLEEIRAKIDLIDVEILESFSKRMELARAIGKIKKENNITILQLERWKALIEDRKKISEKLSLNDNFIEKLMNIIHQESIAQQNKVMNENNLTNTTLNTIKRK